MRKLDFRLVALDGTRIDSRPKEISSREVDGTSRFAGHRFILKTRLFGDKRCIYCGDWFHWTESDCLRAMREGYVDDTNRDNICEPLHCGKDHCAYFHKLCLDSAAEKQAEREERHVRLFKNLMARGLVT